MSAFSGGARLTGLLTRIKESFEGEHQVRVGFLEGSNCGIDNDQPAPEIAFILETGAPKAGIPPRPFFHQMIADNSTTWGKSAVAFFKANEYDLDSTLAGVGLIMGEQLQLSITRTTTPPNAPATIKAKGFDKPLEHSKNMKRSIEFEINGERTVVSGSA